MEFDDATLRAEPDDGPSRDETVDVGTRIARLRTSNGWTLQGTARRTGVAFSTLSKIERQDLSPTVTTLTKIARGMGLTLSQLLEAPHPVVGVARRSIARGAEGRVSATSTCDNMILCSDLTNRKMTPIRTRVHARDLTVYDEWASYDAEIFLTVLSGTLVIHSQSYVSHPAGRGGQHLLRRLGPPFMGFGRRGGCRRAVGLCGVGRPGPSGHSWGFGALKLGAGGGDARHCLGQFRL